MTNPGKRVSLVLEMIKDNPGIHFRNLMAITHMPNGTLSHYVKKIEGMGLVTVERRPRQTRFFSLSLGDMERRIATALRKETPRRIILYLMSEGDCGSDFASIPSNIEKSPSTVSTYLSQLVEEKIISIQYSERKKKYYITDRKSVDMLIDRFHPDFVERASDSFADIINSL